MSVEKWCESTLSKTLSGVPFGQFQHFQRKSSVLSFLAILKSSERIARNNGGTPSLFHLSFRILTQFPNQFSTHVSMDDVLFRHFFVDN